MTNVSHYAAGTRFERAVRAHLEAEGYDPVIRSAGSKTKVDLVALKPGQLLLIQAKVNSKISPAERDALTRIARAAGPSAVPLVAYRDKGVKFWRLTGVGPRDRVAWTTDEVAEAGR